MRFTDDQQKVIDLRKQNILVSAAAGSGKTAVLVERILGLIMDPQEPVDVDRLLVVTFTKAAATEMRERIGKAIAERLSEDPENVHLQRQSALIHNAQVTTIDSFCTFLLRNHFQEAGIDPGFRVGDEGELQLIRRDVLADLLEEEYASGDPAFLELTDAFGTGRSDSAIEGWILDLYDFSMSYPWPEEWLSGQGRELKGEEDLEKSPLIRFALSDIRRNLLDVREEMLRCQKLVQTSGGPYMYGASVDDTLESLSGIEGADTWQKLRQVAEGVRFGRLSSKSDESVLPELKEECKKVRDLAKKKVDALQKGYFLYTDEAILRYGNLASAHGRELIRLVLAYGERFAEAKRKKNLVDFSDLEHFALRILCHHTEDGKTLPTDTALSYREYFREVMCDEYQDSNLVQETLLGMISRENDRFMVGDVKQSIYRFRMARPELFMEKYHTYTPEPGKEGIRIDLHQNFRSRTGVIDSVNFLFRALMDGSLGNIDYDDLAALKPGADYPVYPEEALGKTELLIRVLGTETDDGSGTDTSGPEEDGAAGGPVQKDARLSAEAEMIAERIHRILEGPACVTQRKKDPVTGTETSELRKARFGDMVILLRSDAGKADIFKSVLEDSNIPCFIQSKTGYYDATEVATLLQLLKSLNNPLEDIPLFGVLHSVFGGFSDRELAQMRADRNKEESLYASLKACAEGGSEKAADFLTWFESLRDETIYLSISELLEKIIEEKCYLEYVTALPAGEQRRANVLMLMQKAVNFEQTSFKGLYHFVRYIEQLRKYNVDEGEASILDENANVVRIMTIHKSKGLEFPICFVAGLGGSFNRMDEKARVITDMDFGLAMDHVDPERRIRVKTLQRQLLARKVRLDAQAEELRVLYVALTRAREKLILTGFVKSPEDLTKLDNRIYGEEEVLPFGIRSGADSFLQWIYAAVKNASLRGAQIPMEMEFVSYGSREAEKERKEGYLLKPMETFLAEMAANAGNGALEQELEAKFSYRYPYEILQDLYAKTTVSELKMAAIRGLMDPEEEEGYAPYGMEGGETLEKAETAPGAGGALHGSAMHRFMELYDFTAGSDAQAVETQLRSFRENGRMSPEFADSINLGQIKRFLDSPLGKRTAKCAAAGQIRREQPFVMGIPASRLGKEYPDTEQVLVQGIIDLYLTEEDGEIVLVDYKTDRVKTPESLAERYKTQMDYYTEALEKLTGKRVKERILYSFSLGCEVKVD